MTASNAEQLAQAVSAFGAAATVALSNPAITGEPEEQLRTPLVVLFKALAPLSGLGGYDAELVGETRLSDLTVRPDFAVTRKGALIGFIEVKAPAKGADPTRFKTKHDKEQWEKLKALPNLIYTNGNAFSLWRDGERAMPIVTLDGDVESSGNSLKAPPELLALFTAFFGWSPIPPRTPKQLAETTARLCRLLRDEVSEQLERKAPGLTSLAEDWRQLLFPHATDGEFADGYAQAVTFGLLMARARNIPLTGGIEEAAKLLRQSNSLIGSALRLLTEDEGDTLKTSLRTLTVVLDVVDWAKLSKGEPEAWLYFYELFLQQYDTALRKRTGSYYTPPQVVTAMVRMVDDALRAPGRFNLIDGLASPEVSLADPAVGTGTFLLGALQRIRSTIEARDGAGAVPAAITASLSRLIGFELQFGPFAVAQLRVLAELIDLVTLGAGDASEERQKALSTELRLYITDTLADPDEEAAWIPSATWPGSPRAAGRPTTSSVTSRSRWCWAIRRTRKRPRVTAVGWKSPAMRGARRWKTGSRRAIGAWEPTPSTCATSMSTSGVGRRGRCSAARPIAAERITRQQTGRGARASSASSRSPGSSTARASRRCAPT